MHRLGIACNKAFDLGLRSSDGLKLEFVKRTANNIFMIAVKIW